MKLNLSVLICYNEPFTFYQNYLGKELEPGSEVLDLSERNFISQLNSTKKLLSKRFRSVSSLAIGRDLLKSISDIKAFAPDVIINFVETIEGKSNFESYFAGLYEILGIPYTGNTPMALENCLYKSRTKQILTSFGINTPRFIKLESDGKLSKSKFDLKFPIIVKLLNEDASIGISENSVVYTFENLQKRIKYLKSNFNQPMLIEEYIDGREFNVAILGEELLPISEIVFESLPDHLPKIVTYEAKWSEDSIYYKNTVPKCPAVIKTGLRKRLEKTAYAAYKALECRDYARVDIRLSKKNVPFVIEVNPNPDVSSDAGFARAANAAGINYEELLFRIAMLAANRIKK
ncbi:MAG: D-alanine--D-alanine ligase [Melioribacteraceae bacterium]